MFRSQLSKKQWTSKINPGTRTAIAFLQRGLSTRIGASSANTVINESSNTPGVVSDSFSSSFSTLTAGRQVKSQFSFDHWSTKKTRHHRQSSFISPSLLESKYDVVIIGGGVVGSMIALHLVNLNDARKILVIERDSTYRIASAQLSAGGCRQQFSLPENIKMVCIHLSDCISIVQSINQSINQSLLDFYIYVISYLNIPYHTYKG